MNDYAKFNTFKQWMLETYEHDDYLNINHSGCQGGVSGLIYYNETNAIYDAFADELHDILSEYKDMTGEIPDYIIKNLDSATQFKNAVVWFVAEWYADEYITNWETNHEEV